MPPIADLIADHSPFLRKIAEKIVSPGHVDDVLQLIYYALWRGHNVYDPARGTLKSWLGTIARNTAISYLRQQCCRLTQDNPLHKTLFSSADPGDTLPPSSLWESIPDPNSDASDKEVVLMELNKALETLPAEQAYVVRLHFLLGMSEREIAAMSNCPRTSVHTRLHSGLQKLRSYFHVRNATNPIGNS